MILQLEHLQVYGFISLLSCVCYIRNYNGDFVFDDIEAIVNNKDVLPDNTFKDVFWHDFWGHNITKDISHKSYRPMTVLTFRVNYWLASGLHPTGFHVLNILLHTWASALLYKVLCRIIDWHSKETSLSIARMTTVLFVVHPVHTEAVSGIVGRAELLCTITFLSSFNYYISARQAAPTFDRFWCYIVCFVLCFMSVLFKEQGITVLGLCFVYDISLKHKWKEKNILRVSKQFYQEKDSIFRLAFLFLCGLIILSFRWWVMGGKPPTFQKVDNPHSFIDSILYRVLNYQYLYTLNLWLFVCPWWLCFDWSMGCVPLINSLLDIRLVTVLSLWLIALSFACRCFYFSNFNRHILFAFSFIIVPFLPASNLLFKVGFVIAERVLYVPSVGFCLLLALSVHKINISLPKYKTILTRCVHLLVFLYILRTIRRCGDWQNETALFESAEHVCPLNAKVHYNIGKVNADKGNELKAIEEYRIAIRLNPLYDQALNNLGNLLKERGELKDALQLLEQATSIRLLMAAILPSFAAAWMNLGIVQNALNYTVAAEKSYHTAIKHRNIYPDCYYNLGNLYLDESRYNEALAAWRNATLQNVHHISAWFNLLTLLDNLERFEDFKVLAEEGLKWNPKEASLHYSYANGLGKLGDYGESEVHFMEAIKLNPGSGKYQSNLGVLYHRWKKYEKAAMAYKAALEIEPDNPHTIKHLNMLNKQMKKVK